MVSQALALRFTKDWTMFFAKDILNSEETSKKRPNTFDIANGCNDKKSAKNFLDPEGNPDRLQNLIICAIVNISLKFP